MPAHLAALERAELDAFTDLYRSATADVRRDVGLSLHETGHAVVFVVDRLDVLALNRAVGLGRAGAVPDADLDRMLDVFARSRAPRFFVPVAPFDGHDALTAALEARGVRPYNAWMRLSRRLDALPAPDGPVEIRQIGPDEAVRFGEIVATAFGYPAPLAPLAALPVGRPGWHHYLASMNGTTIGAGAMFLSGSAAWFGFAATEAAYRGRGAQRALVIRRMHDARAAGCDWVSVETAEDSIEKDAPSFRNLTRLGFEAVYRRPNHLWTRPA
jgi:hypothetical protein